jgi:lipopolysaccharide/colanic/teichoic acid biosynthesis glycosyltransferase
MIKRIFDMILASAGILMALPLGIVIGLLVWAEDRAPVFYIQDRVGKAGRIFKGIKFRSMVPDADRVWGPVQARENDVRFTRIGRLLRRTAMDELPQLVNILIGDMSFVGPRALVPKETAVSGNAPIDISKLADFRVRITVPPGLTGPAQIFAPRDIAIEKKFKYDVWYVKNKNLLLDIRLIFLSFLVTFMARWERRGCKFNLLGAALKRRIEDQAGLAP